jgi:hypothetical protein
MGRRAVGDRVIVERQIGIARIGQAGQWQIGADARRQRTCQLARFGHQGRLLVRALGRQLGRPGADDADGEHEQRHQYFDERKTVV